MTILLRTAERMILLGMLTLTCAYGGVADLPDSERALYERLLEEYPKALEKLILKNFECTGTMEDYELVKGERTSLRRWEINCRILDGFGLVERRPDMVGDRSAPRLPFETEVGCETPRYMFHLQRSAENSPWTVRAHSASKRDMEMAMVLVGTYCRNFVDATHAVREVPFEKLFDGSTCDVLSVRPGDDNTVRVELQLGKDPWWFYDTASVTLDPDFGWTIREYTLTNDVPEQAWVEVTKGTVESQEWMTAAGETVIFPKSVTIRYEAVPAASDVHDDEFDTVSIEHIEFHTISLGTVSPEDFTLAAYGLPEMPLQGVPRSRRTMLWWFIALNVSAAAFFLSVWYRRKKSEA